MFSQEYSKLIALGILVAAAGIIIWFMVRDLCYEKDLKNSGNPSGENKEDKIPSVEFPKDKDSREFLFLNYEVLMRAAASIGQVDWQISTLSVAATVGVLAAGLSYIHNPLASGLVMVGGSIFDFALAVALSKNHLSRRMLQTHLRNIELSQKVTLPAWNTQDIAKYLLLYDENYKNRSNRFLRFFQRRDNAPLLVGTILGFAVVLFAAGIITIYTWSIL